MRRYLFGHRIPTAVAVILSLSIASCGGGGPTSPDDPPIALSATSIVFSNDNAQTITLTNLESEPVEWRVLASTASWLTASPTTGMLGPRESSSIMVQVNRQAVPAGTHTAEMRIGPPRSPVSLNVSVQPLSSARAALAPQALSIGSTAETGTVQIVNSGNAALQWTLSGPSWLTVSPASGNLSPGDNAQVVVTPVRSQLPAGHHAADLQLTSNGGSARTSVTVEVLGISGLRFEPADLDFGTTGTQLQLRVMNDTNHALNWDARSGSSWISLSKSSGQLPPKLSQLITVSASRAGLAQGTTESPILFTTDDGSTTASVRVTVPSASGPGTPSSNAEMRVTPLSLNFGDTTTELAFQVHNAGNARLDWAGHTDAAWLSLTPGSGQVAAQSSGSVTARINRSGLTPGTYRSTIKLSSPGGTATVLIEATVKAGAPENPAPKPPPQTPPPPPPPPTEPPPPPPKLAVTPVALSYGLTQTQLSFRVQNTGGTALSWSAQPGAGWISSLSVTSGQLAGGDSQGIVVLVSRSGLSASGVYQSTIQVSSNGGSFSLPVTLQVPSVPPPPPPPPPPPAPPKLAVTPVALSYGLTATQLSFRVHNTGGSALSWSAQEDADWISSFSVSSGQLGAGDSQSVAVVVSRSSLSAAGTYQSTIQVSSNGGALSLPVTVQVPTPPPPPPPKLVVTPVALSYGLTLTQLSFKVRNTGGTALSWSAQPSAGWISSLSVSGGQLAAGDSQAVAVVVSRSGLTAGTYQSTIQVSSNGGAFALPVTMQVPSPTPPPPPKLVVTPVALSYGLTLTQLSFTVENTGGSALSWSAQPNAGWISSLSVSSGQLAAGDSQAVAVVVSRSGLTAGTYQSSIQVSSNGGSFALPATLQVPTAPPPPPPPTGGSSVNVRDFGAKGDGVSDDSPAFERAIDALPASGGTVVVPTGTYLLEPMFLSPVRPLSLIEKTNVSMVGQGMDSTTLKMVNGSYPGSTFMLLILNSSGIQIRDLTFDMNRDGSWYGDEQSHIVRVESSQDVHFSNVRFKNSPGDGIKFIGLGELGNAWVDEAWVENSVFYNMWRNGITIQRGVSDLRIRNNTFERVSQQSISSEPTGFDGAATDILIENNVIRHFSGSYAIALSGGGSLDPIKRLTFRNNTVDNGAVFFLWVDNIQVDGNTLHGGPKKSALRLQDISGGLVANNRITGNVDGASAVLQILNDAQALSHDVTIRDNLVDARAGNTGIHVRDGGARITVTGNEVLGSGNARGLTFETLVSGLGSRSGYTVLHNEMENFKDAIAFVVRGDRFTDVRIESNTANHDQLSMETVGILLDRTGTPDTFAQILANIFGAGIDTPLRVLGG